MFRARAWPEGYEFPACSACQSVSSKDEMLVAFLSRMNPNTEDAKELAAFEDLIRSVENNFPGISESMRLSVNRKRAWVERRGHELPSGLAAGELPLVSIEDPRFEAAVTTFATKLFMALYYLHTRRIVPRGGGARFRWWTNAQDLSPLNTPELQQILSRFPELKRARTSLEDQFSYRFAAPVDNPDLYAFLVTFNRSFVMMGMVAADLSRLPVQSKAITVQPYLREAILGSP
jgi:hypothetical protein